MCYGATHDCVVTCINDHLNTTALQSGIVIGESGFRRCTIACAEGIPIDSGSTGGLTGIGFDAGISTITVIAIVVGMVVFAIFIDYLWRKSEKELLEKRE
jgi:hypothetical protein